MLDMQHSLKPYLFLKKVWIYPCQNISFYSLRKKTNQPQITNNSVSISLQQLLDHRCRDGSMDQSQWGKIYALQKKINLFHWYNPVTIIWFLKKRTPLQPRTRSTIKESPKKPELPLHFSNQIGKEIFIQMLNFKDCSMKFKFSYVHWI